METGLVKSDDVLFLRFLLLGALALEVSELLALPKPAFGLEQPDDPEPYLWPAPANVGTNLMSVNRPVDGCPSFWATSEWKEFQSRNGVTVASLIRVLWVMLVETYGFRY